MQAKEAQHTDGCVCCGGEGGGSSTCLCISPRGTVALNVTGVEGNGQVDKLVQVLQVKSDDDIF